MFSRGIRVIGYRKLAKGVGIMLKFIWRFIKGVFKFGFAVGAIAVLLVVGIIALIAL